MVKGASQQEEEEVRLRVKGLHLPRTRTRFRRTIAHLQPDLSYNENAVCYRREFVVYSVVVVEACTQLNY